MATEAPDGARVEARDPIAEPLVCGRCGIRALLIVVGRCADCVARIGLEDGPEYEAWRGAVHERVLRGPGAHQAGGRAVAAVAERQAPLPAGSGARQVRVGEANRKVCPKQ